jgi:hypothetical protein
MRRHEPSGFGTKPSWEHEMSADDSTQMRRSFRSLAIFVVITLGSASEGNLVCVYARWHFSCVANAGTIYEHPGNEYTELAWIVP